MCNAISQKDVMVGGNIAWSSQRYVQAEKGLKELLLFANNFGTLIYVVFLACIFVELFLNKECTYLDDF